MDRRHRGAARPRAVVGRRRPTRTCPTASPRRTPWRSSKRVEAGYEDDPLDLAPAPNAAVALGTTQLAVDLYRGRGSTDTFASYAELDSFAQTFGNWSTIRRLLGIGRAQVDRALVPTPTLWRRGVFR